MLTLTHLLEEASYETVRRLRWPEATVTCPHCAMTTQLRQAIANQKPEVQLAGTVECDEVYLTARHKGHPEAVQKKGVKGGGGSTKGFGARAHWRRKSRRSSG